MSLLYSLTDTDRRRVRYPKWQSARYYDTRTYLGGQSAPAALTANRIQASPLWVPPGVTADRIAIDVTTADLLKIARLMLYLPGPDDLPGALLVDAGTVDAGTAGFKELTINQVLPPGLLYAAVVSDGAPALRIASISYVGAYGNTITTFANEGGSVLRDIGGTTAPDPFGSAGLAFSNNVVFLVAVRAV